jgi:hypothetical protein
MEQIPAYEVRSRKDDRGVDLVSAARREAGQRFMDTIRPVIHSARRSSSSSLGDYA